MKHLDKGQQVLLNYRLAQIRKHDNLLYSNTDEIMQKELKLHLEDQTIDSLLNGDPNKNESPIKGRSGSGNKSAGNTKRRGTVIKKEAVEKVEEVL